VQQLVHQIFGGKGAGVVDAGSRRVEDHADEAAPAPAVLVRDLKAADPLQANRLRHRERRAPSGRGGARLLVAQGAPPAPPIQQISCIVGLAFLVPHRFPPSPLTRRVATLLPIIIHTEVSVCVYIRQNRLRCIYRLLAAAVVR
jgi:hypothetical protein